MISQRNPGIDLIRGLSIILVILLHCYIRIPLDHTWLNNFLPQRVVNIIFYSGYYGVITFFVVSGFLITSMAIKKWGNLQNIQCQEFYLMRFARIMPCLIALLVILSLLHIFRIDNFVIQTTTLKQAVLSALTFHINWLEAKTGYLPGPWDVLWSLSVEEVFYLFFPLICFWIRNENIFILLMLVFVVLGPFARTVFSTNDIWMDHSYLSCMDGIAFGCLAALWANKINIQKSKSYLFIWLGLSVALFIFLLRKQTSQLGLTSLGLNVTLLEIGIALLLVGLQLQFLKGKKPLRNRCVTFIGWFGRNSYEIYLSHLFVVIFITHLFYQANQSGYLLFLWYCSILILSGVVGNLVARYYSEPINKLLRNMQLRNLQQVQNKMSAKLTQE